MISFVRIDDRVIHGQVVTRWSKSYPCDGIVVVNDKIANTPVLKQSFKSSTPKKVLIWTYDHFNEKKDEIVKSSKNYFLITKEPLMMAKILVDDGFKPSDVKRVVVGPISQMKKG